MKTTVSVDVYSNKDIGFNISAPFNKWRYMTHVITFKRIDSVF